MSERVGAEPGLGGRQESETAGTAGRGEGDCSYSPGTGEPQQVLRARKAGAGLCFRKTSLTTKWKVAGRERGKTGAGDQGGV